MSLELEPEPGYLTTQQLADLYPVRGHPARSLWYRELERWRTLNLLRPEHICEAPGRWRCPCRAYHHVRVCHILWTSERRFAESVRRHHREALRSILLAANVPNIPKR
jgi:hypothetical protein